MTRVALVAGLSIYLYANEGSHKEAHFHVRGNGVNVSVEINNPDKARGQLPGNKRKDILDFARRRRGDLLEAMAALNAGVKPEWIEG